jgi:hypothetical protein
MARAKVFLVHLRRPRNHAGERRDDPYYEFGSFGCTGCHSRNLMHPRHADELEGARLGFVQGGHLGTRLVYLSPPIKVVRWKDRCEARWRPHAKPFRYAFAPILASNRRRGDFHGVERFARATRRTSIEGGLSSRFRNRTKALDEKLAAEVVQVYERLRSRAGRSSFAKTYDLALPFPPPDVDRQRRRTYLRRLRELRRAHRRLGSRRCPQRG